jgi:hypothetical protein
MSDFQILDMEQLLAAGVASKRPWFAADLIPHDGVTIIYGPCADDVAIPLARAIATGDMWNGCETYREAGFIGL